MYRYGRTIIPHLGVSYCLLTSVQIFATKNITQLSKDWERKKERNKQGGGGREREKGRGVTVNKQTPNIIITTRRFVGIWSRCGFVLAVCVRVVHRCLSGFLSVQQASKRQLPVNLISRQAWGGSSLGEEFRGQRSFVSCRWRLGG